MAYIIRHTKDTSTYDTTSVTEHTTEGSNSQTVFSGGYDYYINIPRRCARCRMYDLEPGICKKKKDWKTCKKNYSIKRIKIVKH